MELNNTTWYIPGFGKLKLVSKQQIQNDEYRYIGNDDEDRYMIYEKEVNGYQTGQFVATLTF